METKIVVNGVEYPVVTEADMTLGEAAEVERITGQGYDLEAGGALALLAIAFVSVRRVDPRVTLDDLQLLKAGDIGVIAPDGDAVIPPPLSADSEDGMKLSGEPSGPVSEPTLESIPDVSGREA